MNELVVCSGKGGTGKTSVVASLASLAEDFVLVDCDVDAANLHLVLDPVVEKTTPFIAGHTAQIRQVDCEACGECHALCRFSAINKTEDPDGVVTYEVDPLLCEEMRGLRPVLPHRSHRFPKPALRGMVCIEDPFRTAGACRT